jgi:RHS repeat-associated protein
MSASLPFLKTWEEPETKNMVEGQIDWGEGEWWWLPDEGEGISAIEFVGISASATLGPEDFAEWDMLACGQSREWLWGETAPTSVRFEPTKVHTCNQANSPRETVTASMTSWTSHLYEEEPEPPYKLVLKGSKTTVNTSLSVAAVLTTRPVTSAEEEELETELYGERNPAKSGEDGCYTAKPVNCATGNETISQTDLAVGGRGPGLNLTRTYNSRGAAKASTHGPFGYGWTGSYSAHLSTTMRCHGLLCNETIAKITQDNGSTVSFDKWSSGKWNPIGPLVQATLAAEGEDYAFTLPNQTVLHFDSTGKLTSEVDRNGNTLTMSYAEGRLETVTDDTGRKLTFAYNAEGEVESVKDPMGHTVKYTYEAGNLKSVTQPGEASLRWQFKYDSSHELTSVTDGRSHTTTIKYESRQVVSETDPLSRTYKWKYEGSLGWPSETVITEPNGSITHEHFNAAGQLTEVTHAFGTAIASTSEYKYDSKDDLIAMVDPDKHETKYTYNESGDRTSEKNAAGNEAKWTYDSTHHVLTSTTPDGETATIKRDSHGNPEVIERPAPGATTQTTRYTYDAHGDVESMEDPLKRVTKYEYDSYGDKSAEIDPAGDKQTWTYNEDSQEISSVTDRGNVEGAEASKYTVKTERDSQGRAITNTDPLGHATKYTYDGDGNLETVTDPLGHKTKYVYDADNELTKTEEPKLTTTETGYDSAGAVTSQTDGNKNTTKYVRNLLEQVTEVIDPKERKTLKEYDPAGNLKTVTDPAKRVTTYTYDAANRLKEITYSDGKTPTVKYEYSGDGKVTRMTDGTGETVNTYDQLDRLTESQNGHKETIGYEYDLANELTKLTYPNGKAITLAYDKASRLEKVTDWLGNVTKFTYNADSEINKTTFPSMTSDEDTYAYNEADQMSEVKMLKGAETLASLAYTRDTDGQLKGITSKGLPGEEKPAYEYDTNNRLTKGAASAYGYDSANNPTKLGTGTYTYDKADQLETGPSLKYEYNSSGQRTKTTPTGGSATTYGYDQAGNLISIERPKEGEKAAINDTYTYDGNSTRASQTVSGTTTYLAWDMSEPLPLLLADGISSYIYGPGGLPIEQINNTSGTVLYLHHDQQGSTRLLTGSTGKTEGSYSYSAYGTVEHAGTATTPLGYDAQYTSSDTGLVYLRARVYDPATAQFLSVDPVASVTRAPYNYANDNPANLIDPSGQIAAAPVIEVCADAPEACILAGGAIGVGGVIFGHKAAENAGQEILSAISENERPTDEGEAELQAKEADRGRCGNPAQAPGSKFEWKGKGPVGSSEGSWWDPDTDESLYPHLGENSHGPHYYDGPSGRYRIYPGGRIEPK